jgi:UDP-galactopyranose mutase
MRAHPVVILGSGPAGIGAALALDERGLILESLPDVGGLCRTIEFDGAVFDLGGHSFHTPHPEVRKLVFNAVEMFEQPRDARCFSHGRLIPYPFQQHFRELPAPSVVRECLSGLQAAAGGAGARHFAEHVVDRFGEGIARHFLRPYNRKLWKTDLSELAVDWVGERVAAPEGQGNSFAKDGGKRTPLASDTTVAYPARGGFGEILRALATRLPNLHCGQTVTRIDPRRRELALHSGKVLRWQRVISTLALPRLLALIPDVPADLVDAAAELRTLPLALVLVSISHPVDTPIQRIYSADSEWPAHKLVINHNSSDYLRSLPHHGILAEVSLPPGSSSAPRNLEWQVVLNLLEAGLVKTPAEVRSTCVLHIPHAYPVPTHSRTLIVHRITDWLRERDIDSVGRFGEWAYINADEALARGLALGRRLSATTLTNPPRALAG